MKPDYEVSAVLDCWSPLEEMPINISFKLPLSTNPKEYCTCCTPGKVKKASYLQHQSTINLAFEGDGTCETYKVVLNKNRVLKVLKDTI